MDKIESHRIETEITVREAFLISEALELLLKTDREDRSYARVSELAKLADEMRDLWSDHVHHDYDKKRQETQAA